ncbi:MAG: hypothetical protein C4521_09810 [Actinobacteria bacterium]|nr:MAG: hypothetical protein C4521_09810 [Actinomycetota bacterium]
MAGTQAGKGDTPGAERQDVQDEISVLRSQAEALRRENERLKERMEATEERGVRKPGKWRQALAIVLLVAGCVIAPFSVTAVWLNRQVVDTDAFVSTVEPLSQDPAIQEAAANYTTAQLFSRVNVEELARENLPDRIAFLAPPLANGVRSFTNDAVLRIVESPQFSEIWVRANRRAHEALLAVLEGRGEGVVGVSEDGSVTLDLGRLVDLAKARLSGAGVTVFERIPPVDAEFALFNASVLARARGVVSLLNRLALILPLLVPALLASAVAIAIDRRRTAMWTGIGLALAMAGLAIGLAALRSYYLSIAVGPFLSPAAATAIFDILVVSLRLALRTVFVFGLVVFAGALLAGPSEWAVRLRTSLSRGLRGIGAGWDFGVAGAWIARRKNLLRGAGIVIALVVLIALEQPTAGVVLAVAAALLVYIGLIEFFGRGPKGPEAEVTGISAGEKAVGKAPERREHKRAG